MQFRFQDSICFCPTKRLLPGCVKFPRNTTRSVPVPFSNGSLQFASSIPLYCAFGSNQVVGLIKALANMGQIHSCANNSRRSGSNQTAEGGCAFVSGDEDLLTILQLSS